MAGRLQGTADGRPWSCTANAEHIEIRFKSMKSLPAVRSAARAVGSLLHGASGLTNQPMTVKLGLLPPMRLKRQPGLIERLLVGSR